MGALQDIPIYLKASRLRQDLFKMLDLCVSDHKVVWIERGNDVFKLEAVTTKKKLGSLPKRIQIIGNIEGLVDFSPSEWKPDDLS